MKTIEWAVPLGVLTTAAVIYAFMKVGEERKQNVFKDRHLIERGSHTCRLSGSITIILK